MVNPYLIDRPGIVSFSGGRTSGFMLRQIIDAFGGTLPEDVRVCFCNTGLEHPKTLDFVHEVEVRWDVPVHWLEYRVTDDAHDFAEVTFETASRNGEPFSALTAQRGHLPNPVTRFCTTELKIRTTKRYVQSLGWPEYTNAIGLRADEPWRVAKMKGDIKAEHTVMPMSDAGHTLADVLAFWKAQPFDLDLPGGNNAFGNCVGCFLKGAPRLLRLMKEEPAHFEWWKRAEAEAARTATTGARFRSDRPSYAAMLEIARTQGVMDFEQEEAVACHCTD